MAESPVTAGPLCKHGLSTSFPCGKCRSKQTPKQIPYLVLVVAVLVLGTLIVTRS